MCGISGIINNKQQLYGSNDLRLMTEAIRHRGPNDVGYMLIENDGNIHLFGDKDTPSEVYNSNTSYSPKGSIEQAELKNFKLAFGHRRLSIIDLSVYGHLPMCYDNGRYWITFNGEIYNYRELKQELQDLGHAFISQTDTEVILAAYKVWGTACQEKFHGMWAFCICDTITKDIFLSRDRFGIKPLYYWVSPSGAFCFGSEIKQFTFLPGWKAILNKARGFDYLVHSMIDHTDQTMFQGVFQVPAGCFFKSAIENVQVNTNGKIQISTWYAPAYTGFKGPFEEATKTFEQYFKNSLKEHLVSDVTVGAALSGGLDSSSIVCEIDDLLKKEGKEGKLKTFSYCANDERYNEKKWIDEVIKVTNVEAHYVSLNGQEVFEKAEKLVWQNDEPSQSQSLLANYQVYKIARENNVKVIINGQGADEYLSGYGAFKKYRWVKLLKRCKFRELNVEIANLQKQPLIFYFSEYFKLFYFVFPSFVRKFFSRRTTSFQNLKTVISFQHLNIGSNYHPYDNMNFKKHNIFNISNHQLKHEPLPKYLHYEDRMSMAHSIEARVPFLDHRLVEFANQMPADYLDGLNETKKMMLHGLKDILPESIRNRKDKIGFITSEEKWVKEEFTIELRSMLENSIKLSKGIIKPEALQYFDKVVKGDIAFDYTYWRLILFGIWMNKFSVELS